MSSRVSTFFTNLNHDAGHHEALERQLDALGLPYQRFPGIYGRTLPANELVRYYNHTCTMNQSRELTVGEVGCVLSRLGVYRAMIERNLPYALILEDDAKLGPDVPVVLGALVQSVPPDEPVVILLTYIDHYHKRNTRPLTTDHRTAKFVNYQWLARGYFVMRATAKRMVEQFYSVWLATDYWYKFERRDIVQMCAVIPYVIGVQDFDSDPNLGADRAIKSREADDRLGLGHHLRQISVRKSLCQIFVRPFLGIVKQKETW